MAKPPLRSDRVVDTLMLARRRHPAGPNSLDALCKRYGIDNSIRIKHGALMDSLLLANVYVELLGERQATLGLGGQGGAEASVQLRIATARPRPEPLRPRLSEAGGAGTPRVRQDARPEGAVVAVSLI